MQEDNLVAYRNPGIALPVADALTEVLRRGAGTLLQQAVEAEVTEVIARFQELKDERGRQRPHLRDRHSLLATRWFSEREVWH